MRRNIYEQHGKDVTPAAEKSTNGEPNGEAAKSLEEALKEPAKPIYCNSCGVDTTRVLYHMAKTTPNATGKAAAQSKYDICPNCYLDGRFPQNTSAADYVKLESETYGNLVRRRDTQWSETEIFLLLEALELFDDNWDMVSEHINTHSPITRTREECILQFLQLGIEDQYLENDGVTPDSNDPVKSLAYFADTGRIPFDQADNPVMSVMGFLAGLADPAVTAAAAGRSVDEMRRTLKSRLDKGSLGKEQQATSGKGKEKEGSGAAASSTTTTDAVKDEDSMEVDRPSSPQANDSNAVAKRESIPKPGAVVPLALTAARATALAAHEERHVTSLLNSATNLQLQKLSLKLQQFSELEALLAAERRDLERRRQQLFLDRLAFSKKVRGLEDAVGRTTEALRAGQGDQGISALLQAVAAFNLVEERLQPGKTGDAERDAIRPLSEEGGEGYKALEI